MPKHINKQYFARDTLTVAKDLIGCVLTVGHCSGRIVEVEAYTDDEASHGHRRTERSALMQDTFGMVYVYFIYGMYHCLNFTTDQTGAGAVLIRALEPIGGIEMMKRRRGVEDLKKLCSGPGKLCQALGIDLKDNGIPVGKRVMLREGRAGKIISGSRIGIKKAVDLNWRFLEQGNRFVSRS